MLKLQVPAVAQEAEPVVRVAVQEVVPELVAVQVQVPVEQAQAPRAARQRGLA